ncbi:hypothetical protein V491_06029 [Pseudogymnoascus sp. VKM F-3775]|nr:hypothetical protein V491_06029 [Pseudogymnoascus sp. VKM F-3775]
MIGSSRLSNSNLYDLENKTGTSDEQASELTGVDPAGRVSPICMSGEDKGAAGCLIEQIGQMVKQFPPGWAVQGSGKAGELVAQGWPMTASS